MSEQVEVGSISARRGSRTFGYLPVATSANGGDLRIGGHILAGAKTGPKMVVMAGSHGNELAPMAGVKKVVEEVDPSRMAGDLIVIPVQNPVAFEMGARGTWIDGLWGDSGNMNRLWPGRANGWLTERFTHVISSSAFPGANVIMDLHGPTPDLHLSYGYLGGGAPGDLDYDVARAFGQEMLVWNSTDDLKEKNQTTSTAKAAARIEGYSSYSGEMGEFYGLADSNNRSDRATAHRDPVELGFTGITNVMKHLGMIDGAIKLPARQISVTPELNLRPKHGGLLITNVGVEDLGTVVPRGTVLGTVVSPYSFAVLDEIVAPFDQSLLIATQFHQPFTKVHPGEFVYIVADNTRTEVLT